MKINSISNNQNNSQSFGALIASKRTLKTLGTLKTKLLENPSFTALSINKGDIINENNAN